LLNLLALCSFRYWTLNPDQDTHDPKKSPTDPVVVAKTVVNKINIENDKTPEVRETAPLAHPPQIQELDEVSRISERFIVSSETNV